MTDTPIYHSVVAKRGQQPFSTLRERIDVIPVIIANAFETPWNEDVPEGHREDGFS